MGKSLTLTLKEKGWTEIIANWEYRKEQWIILRDTSSSWVVGTESNPGVLDIFEPTEYQTGWTANLIEHLCKMEDERTRLRKVLGNVQRLTRETQTIELTTKALEECYHTWILVNNKWRCPICNATK